MPLKGQWVARDSLTSLAQLKASFDNINNLQEGASINVAGIASVESGLLHENYLQTYIQNDTSGLSIFAYSIKDPISVGDSVVVKGQTQLYHGQPELLVTNYEVYSRQKPMAEYLDVFEAMENPARHTAMLVKGRGIIKEKGNKFNGKYLMIAASDTTKQTVMIYVSNFHALYQDFDFETPSVGDKITISGVLGQYDPAFPESMTYKVFLRTPADFSYDGWPQYYFEVIGIFLLIIILLGLGWMFSLQRQVKRKTIALEKSLAEKEILLKEIHHRIKNNLAGISGLLELQSSTSENEELQTALQESQTRISSMMMVHEKLYQSVSLKELSIQKYLEDLSLNISHTFTTRASDIDIRLKADSTVMPTDQVVPLGLLVNELLVNAFKHAFKNKNKGIIWVDLKEKNGIIALKVEDNGKGLPGNFNPANTDSLGMLLISTFSEQLGASKTIKNTPGACFIFKFPMVVDTY